MSQPFKKQMLDRVGSMDSQEMRNMLATLIVNCSLSQRTLVASLQNAMNFPIQVYPGTHRSSQNAADVESDGSEDDEDRKEGKKKKKKKKKQEEIDCSRSTRSRTQETITSEEDEADAGESDAAETDEAEPNDEKAATDTRSKIKKRRELKRQRLLEQLRELPNGEKMQHFSNKRIRKAITKHRRLRKKNRRSTAKQLKAHHGHKDKTDMTGDQSGDEDHAASGQMDVNEAEASGKKRSKLVIGKLKGSHTDYVALPDSNDPDEKSVADAQEQTATPASRGSSKKRKGRQILDGAPRNHPKEVVAVSSGEDDEISAAENVARTPAPIAFSLASDNDGVGPRSREPVTLRTLGNVKSTNNGNSRGNTLGESSRDYDEEDDHESSSRRRAQTVFGDARSLRRGRSARGFQQQAECASADLTINEQGKSSATKSSTPAANHHAKKRKRGETDGPSDPMQRKTGQGTREFVRDDHQKSRAQLRCQSAPVSPLDSTNFTSRQDIKSRGNGSAFCSEHQRPSQDRAVIVTANSQVPQDDDCQVKQEADDDEIEMFMSPITPFRNKPAAAQEKRPLNQSQSVPSDPSGVKIGQHTYFVSQNDGNTTQLATPSGSRTLSLGTNLHGHGQHQSSPAQASQRSPGRAYQNPKPVTPRTNRSTTPRSGRGQPSSNRRGSWNRWSASRGAKGTAKTPIPAPSFTQKRAAKDDTAAPCSSTVKKDISQSSEKMPAVGGGRGVQPSTPKRKPPTNANSPPPSLLAKYTPDGEQWFKCRLCGKWFRYSDNPQDACPAMHPGN